MIFLLNMQSRSPFTHKTAHVFTWLFLLCTPFFFGSSIAYGMFESSPGQLTFDGIIDMGKDEAVNAGYYTVLTSGTSIITIRLTPQTKYINGTPDWNDRVRVNAFEYDGDYYAKTIRITKKFGKYPAGEFGTNGDKVTINKGTVYDKTDQTLHVQFGSEHYIAKVHLTSKTAFTGKVKNYSQVRVGDTVTIQGTDKKNQGFVASSIKVTQSAPAPTLTPLPSIQRSPNQPSGTLTIGIAKALLKFDVSLNGITPGDAYLSDVTVKVTGDNAAGIGNTSAFNDGRLYLYNGNNELIACTAVTNGITSISQLKIGNQQDCPDLVFSSDIYTIGSTSGDQVNSVVETYTIRGDLYTATGTDSIIQVTIDPGTHSSGSQNLIWTEDGGKVKWLPVDFLSWPTNAISN